MSRDSPWTHIAWRQALDLNFGLLSDWNAEAIRGFGVAQGVSGHARRRGAGRHSSSTRRATVAGGAWRYGSGDLPDVDELLAAARALGASPFVGGEGMSDVTFVPPRGGEIIGDSAERRVEILSDAAAMNATWSRFGPRREGADLHVHRGAQRPLLRPRG